MLPYVGPPNVALQAILLSRVRLILSPEGGETMRKCEGNGMAQHPLPPRTQGPAKVVATQVKYPFSPHFVQQVSGPLASQVLLN